MIRGAFGQSGRGIQRVYGMGRSWDTVQECADEMCEAHGRDPRPVTDMDGLRNLKREIEATSCADIQIWEET